MKHASKHLKVLARVDILPIHLVIYHSHLSKIVKQSIEKNSFLIQASFFSLARLCVLHPSLNGSSQILNGLLLCSG